MSRPKLLIEQWLPIEAIGAECMRERGASSALPPLYFLHIWWARRPLTVSRAAVLGSILPAYPTREEADYAWPTTFIKTFPTFDSYKSWFISLLGIKGDSAAARRQIEYEKLTGSRTPGNKYGFARAFTVNPNEDQLLILYDLLKWTWGAREITFCDPMSGGGSIPFEALRFGLTVHANELNPVASLVLKATLDYPSRFGDSVTTEILHYGKIWAERLRSRLQPFYPTHPDAPDGSLKGGMHIWARTVQCPLTGKPIPLSPNWWLIKGPDPIAVKMIADDGEQRCRFEIVHGRRACDRLLPDKGTVRSGTAISPWTKEVVPNSYIKSEAKAGRMEQQLYAGGL